MRNVAFVAACVLGFVSLPTSECGAGDGVAVVGATPRGAPATEPTPATPRPPGGETAGNPTQVPAAVSGGYRNWWPPYYVTMGPNGPVMIGPPPPVVYVIAPRPLVGDPTPLGGDMPRPAFKPFAAPSRPKRTDPTRRDQLVTYGDRLFRAGNVGRAKERYEQAVRVDPGSAAPRSRLAQVALTRDDYAEAARRIREAVHVEPDWLPKVNGIPAMYAEPRDFDAVIARLESRVQTEPRDRDAWLVLGAQYYLAGQPRRAADVFLRLADRQPDATLSAFLDATRAVR